MTDTEKAEYEDVLRRLTAECERLVAENARLRSSENTAHSVLREVYNDPTASPAVRVKAAGLALPHETPRLTPQPPAIDATCEEIKPLHQIVEEQRARAARMLLEDPKYRDLPKKSFRPVATKSLSIRLVAAATAAMTTAAAATLLKVE
jgi:hypothetical protein